MSTHSLWRPFAPTANALRQAHRIAHRQVKPGPVQDHSDAWAGQFADVLQLIERAIPDRVLAIDHVGSTAVAGLPAKPVIDVDLTVPDAADEAAYVPRLEAVGFRLIFRDDTAGDPHRQLTLGTPNTNLHVWSPHAREPRRHAFFVAWLRTHEEDRERYAAAKREAVRATSGRYNDAKAAVVYDIYERAFIDDPTEPHDPRPRSAGE